MRLHRALCWVTCFDGGGAFSPLWLHFPHGAGKGYVYCYFPNHASSCIKGLLWLPWPQDALGWAECICSCPLGGWELTLLRQAMGHRHILVLPPCNYTLCRRLQSPWVESWGEILGGITE